MSSTSFLTSTTCKQITPFSDQECSSIQQISSTTKVSETIIHGALIGPKDGESPSESSSSQSCSLAEMDKSRVTVSLPPNLDTLSLEMKHHIFSFLSPSDQSKMSLVSHEIYDNIFTYRIDKVNKSRGNISDLGLTPYGIENFLSTHGKQIYYLNLEKIDSKTALRFIEYCPNLRYLSIKYCRLDGASTQAISKLQKLESLDLSGNPIQNEDAEVISQMHWLKSLDLSFSYISNRGALLISQMKSLRSLKLRNNCIGHEGRLAISQMKELESLDLSGNPIQNEDVEVISQMHWLKSLDLSFSYISNRGALLISQMKSLRSLKLRNNCIGHEGGLAISQMKELESLNLSNNPLSLEAYQSISQMQGLKELCLHSNDASHSSHSSHSWL